MQNPLLPNTLRLAAFVFVGLIPSLGSAASGTWTGATDGTWQENGNWTATPFPDGNAQTATFNSAGSGNTNVTLGGGSITLANFGGTGVFFDTFGVPSYAISNGTINTFQGGTIVRLNPTVVNNQSVTASIVTDSQSILYTTEGVLNYSPAAQLTLGGLTVLSAATGTGSTTYSFRGLGDITVAGAITDNLSGAAPRLTAVANHRAGNLILSGANAFSGTFNGGDTPQSLSGGLGGTVVLDYSSGSTVLTNGTSVTPGRSGNGNLVLKGNTTGTTSLTLSSTQRFAAGYSTITVDKNGGDATTLVLGSDWRGWNTTGGGKMALFDLSSGGQAQVTGTISGGYSISRGIIRNSGGGSAVTVKGTNGMTYFATVDGSNNIVAQTTLETMPTSGSGSFNTNFQVTVDTTLTGSGSFGGNTLRIDGASANQTLNLGGRSWSGAGAMLMDGAHNFTITNYTDFAPGSGVVVMGSGKLTLGGTKTTGDLDKFGPGLLEVTGNHSASAGATWIWGGTYRASSANALTAGVLNMADGVLELGYNFTRALGGSAGQVRAREDAFATTQGASFGFSAYGGDRTVNLGGAGATVTFGTANFVGTRDAKFLLSSATSDSMVEFQNPLNLTNEFQTIEVRNGSAAVDARLSGVISATTGGLIKTGAGALELTATNTYTNSTTVGAGTLIVSGSIPGPGDFVVNTGATLAGTGTVGGGVTVAGTVAAGGVATNGTLTVTGTLAVPGNARFRVFANNINDKLIASGGANLPGAVTVLLDPGYTNVQSGDTFDLIDGSITGTPALSLPALSGGLTWVTNAFLSNGVLSITNGGPVNNYDSWVAYWTNAVPGFTNTAGTADPDGDSFVNNIEFAFDGNPAVGSPAFLTATKSGTNTVFRYIARNSGVTYTVRGTTNLATGGWTNASVTVTNSADTNNINIPADYTRKEFTVPASSRQFYKVEAVFTP